MPEDPTKTPPARTTDHRPPARSPKNVDEDSTGAADEHEGGTEEQVGDRTGPGAGYDDEPEKTDNDSGVAES